MLGYKEPNLVYFMQCQGRCGDENNQRACVPTSVKERAVTMVVKSHLHGHESKQKYKHVTLEEHFKCGCQCKDVRRESDADTHICLHNKGSNLLGLQNVSVSAEEKTS